MKMRKKTKQPNYSKRDNDLFGDLIITLSFLILLGVIVSMTLSFSGCSEKVKTQPRQVIDQIEPADSLINIQGGYSEETIIDDEIGCRECLN